jgi:tRNA(Ile2) C34 agmatinyltransferase TiaS
MEDKFPGDVPCPHCGNANAERLPSHGDYSGYRCPTCGDYRISGTQEHRFDEGHDDPTKGRFTVDSDGRRWLVP